MTSSSTRTRFRVGPGCCIECGADVGAAIKREPGVLAVDVKAAAGIVIVDHDPSVQTDDIRKRARAAGITLIPAAVRAERHDTPWWRQPRVIALGVASVLLVSAYATAGTGRDRAALVLFWAALVTGGVFPTISGLRALRTGRLTISTLLIAAALGAIALGIIEEAALLVVVFSLGEVLEDYASDRARGAIRALMRLTPPFAQRRTSSSSHESVRVEDLAPGDIVIVRPGERIPTDGVVVGGSSAVDQSPVTGESIPVEVTRESMVFGGTVNALGVLEIRVTKEYADTTLARIIRQVEEAQAAKGRAQRFAERFGAIYTPAMFGLAALVAIVPPLLGQSLSAWLYRALVVLTVSCSCALVISVPVSVIAAVTRAARRGILVKGGVHLEALAAIRVVAFDKTGTLTRGRPRVTDVLAIDAPPSDILRLAASIESASEHPLAGAIVEAARDRGQAMAPAREVRAIAGVGIEGIVDGRVMFVGKPRGALPAEVARQVAELEQQGKTVVVLTRGDQPIGLLAVADEVRAGACDAVAALRGLGIEHVLLLTGDNERTAAAIARSVGIDDWHAALMPEDKTAAIVDLRRRYGAIAMVGDGVNDAPALATADVGIAMGAAGTDVALETADVALMADDLAKLPEAISLARRARSNIRQNVTLSLATVSALVIGALAGWLTLTTGLLLNEGSALIIIGNGLRLLAAGGPRSGGSATAAPLPGIPDHRRPSYGATIHET